MWKSRTPAKPLWICRPTNSRSGNVPNPVATRPPKASLRPTPPFRERWPREPQGFSKTRGPMIPAMLTMLACPMPQWISTATTRSPLSTARTRWWTCSARGSTTRIKTTRASPRHQAHQLFSIHWIGTRRPTPSPTAPNPAPGTILVFMPS